jgi:hypothetical protein
MGGAWIHGAKQNPLTKLAMDFKLEFVPGGKSADLFLYDGTPIDESSTLQKEVKKCYSSLLSHMQTSYLEQKKNLEKSFQISMQDLWDQALKELQVPKKYLDPKSPYCQLLQYYQSSREQYEAADFSNLSSHILDAYSHLSGGDLQILGGYGKLLENLTKGLDILTNHKVVSIDYSQSDIEITCENKSFFFCKKCVITTSVGVLQKNPPKFTPSLPSWKSDAINSIGMGLMNKVVLKFPNMFWAKDLRFFGYCDEEKGAFRWGINGYRSTNAPILIMFLSVFIHKSSNLI